MANIIEQQQELIEGLYHIVTGSCPQHYQSARCVFKFFRADDGSVRVGHEFYYTRENIEYSDFLGRELRRPVMELVTKLHTLMASHTDGDWSKFSLVVNEDSSVTTHFIY
ncbi:hypothetical protein BCU12_22240 [Vibrio sp. 10N.261.55.A7]|nr:hypothetical protein BCU12_22240 [Vibrio sp. 10N.261.55.A7]